MHSVLIVEDDPVLLDMYKDKFEFSQFKVNTAVDGEQGLELALREHPELILLDLVMPKMNGTTMMEKLRTDAWGKNVSIIVLTNVNVDGELLKKIIEDRPQYCLMKVGITPDEVMAKAKEIFDDNE
jgi:DNA-binding response OmpR family regulator